MNMKNIFNQEFLDNFIQEILLTDLTNLRLQVAGLLALDNIKDYQQEDLDYNQFAIESIQNTLSYYIPWDEYEEKVGVPYPFQFKD